MTQPHDWIYTSSRDVTDRRRIQAIEPAITAPRQDRIGVTITVREPCAQRAACVCRRKSL